MTNKFQKSVIERQKSEAARQAATLPAEKNQEIAQKVAAATALIIEQQSAPKQERKTKREPSVKTTGFAADIASMLQVNIARNAKNKTFYLDSELIEAIKRAAQAQGVTESRLVNDVMRSVLGL